MKARVNMLARAELAKAEKWDEIDIPPIRFPAGWLIEFVPPFAGAMLRFVATNTHGVKVSVYFDAHGALGAVDEPYWEVYPIGGPLTVADDEDTMRFFGDDTREMIEYIGNLGDPVRGAIVGLGGEVDR